MHHTRKAVEAFADFYNISMYEVDKIPCQIEGIPRPQSDMMQICHLANIQPVNRDQYVDMQQCLEFASAYKIDFEVVASKQTQTYEFLNNKLADRVYLISDQLSPCDIAVYYLIRDLMSHLSLQEKEKYIHLSRWFNFIQQNSEIRKDYSLIPFFRTRVFS